MSRTARSRTVFTRSELRRMYEGRDFGVCTVHVEAMTYERRYPKKRDGQRTKNRLLHEFLMNFTRLCHTKGITDRDKEKVRQMASIFYDMGLLNKRLVEE